MGHIFETLYSLKTESSFRNHGFHNRAKMNPGLPKVYCESHSFPAKPFVAIPDMFLLHFVLVTNGI